MPNFGMTAEAKLIAFADHLLTLGSGFTPFANRYYHPLDDLLDYLLAQVEASKRSNARPAPFQSMADLKARFHNPTNPALAPFEPCFRSLVDCWGKQQGYKALSNTGTLIHAVKPQLDQCKQFACTDAVTFSRTINPAVKQQVLNRAKTSGIATGRPAIPLGGTRQVRNGASTAWNAQHLAEAHAKVYTRKAGECTSFG